jgi:transposase
MKGPRKGNHEEEMSEYEDRILEENTCYYLQSKGISSDLIDALQSRISKSTFCVII